MFVFLNDALVRGSFKSLRKLAALVGFAAILTAGAGCNTKPLTDPVIGPDHELRNVYKKEAVFPGSLKRVAVLPLTYSEGRVAGASADQILTPVFQTELTKVARFEAYFIKPAQLQLWSGRERWDDFEELPQAFLKLIAERTGCDGVLFSRVSNFKAYPPMVVGWRIRLVSNDAGTIWSADEVFDAADVRVANSARRYNRGRTRNNPVLEDSRSILLSPSEFGQYSLASVFGTLPIR